MNSQEVKIDVANNDTKIYVNESGQFVLGGIEKVSLEGYSPYLITLSKSKNGNNITNNKKWRKIEKERWVIYWNTICKSWDMFKKKYYDDNPNPMSPFRSFIYYNQTDCYYFIDWLELYN